MTTSNEGAQSDAQTDSFTVELPLPPSVNSMYFVKGGRKILTSKGKAMKAQMKAIIVEKAVDVLWLAHAENTPLEMKLDLYFLNVENKGWPKKAKSRYKRIDITNRVKLLEDALSEALGLDDCLFFSTHITKNTGKERAICTISLHESHRTQAANADGRT